MTSQHLPSTRIHFTILTIFAVVVLQGILIADSAFGAMLKAIWYRHFDDGKPLTPVYTGMPIVDELLSMSVSFWDTVGTRMPILRLEAIMLCASLQTFAVWATIERMRVGRKHIILQYAPILIFCWQYFGTAIFVPIYCFVELQGHFSPEASEPSVPLLQAKALIPAAAIAVIHPFRMVYFPPSQLTESQHQAHIAFYQLGPFMCYALVATFANYMASDHRDREAPITKPNADAWWIKATYTFFGSFSGIVHVATVCRVIFSRDPTLSLDRLFVPRLAPIFHADAAAHMYVEESLFFLQWDFVLVVLALSLYVTRIVEAMYGSQEGNEDSSLAIKSAAILLCCGVSCVALGPGAVVSAALFMREDFLRKQYMLQEEKMAMDRKPMTEDGNRA